MTLAEIQKIREECGEDKTMVVTCDNEHIFYDNREYSCPLIWDDENERFISFEMNTDQYGQGKLPGRVVYTSYEYIQCIEVYLTMKDMIETLGKFKDKMSENEYNYSIKLFATGAASHMCKPSNAPRN